VEILHDGRATEVDEVLAAAAVAGAAALPVTDVGEGVLDGDAFAEFGPTRRGLLALAQFLEEPLVGVDRYAATVLAAGTPCAQRT